MATAFTDWRTATVGAQPSDWTEGWFVSAGAFAVVADSSLPYRRRLAYTYALSQSVCLLWTAQGQGATRQCGGRIKLTTDGLALWAGFVLGSSTGSSVNGLRVELRSNDGTVRLFDGASQKAATAAGVVAAGTWYYVRFEAGATTFRAKVWAGAVSDEPTSWTLSGSYNTTPPTGYAGVFVSGTSAGGSASFAAFGLATAGETAPLEELPLHCIEAVFYDDLGQPVWGMVDDDGTILEPCFSTHPEHPRPYISSLPAGGVGTSEADFAKGSAKPGTVALDILDVRTDPEDQATGLFTAQLATADGETARVGRRLHVRHRFGAEVRVIADGHVRSVKLNPSLSSFRVEIRDGNERARKTRAFDRTGSCSCFPRGVIEPFGALPNGRWLLSSVTPLTATYRETATGTNVQAEFVLPGVSALNVPPARVYTKAMEETFRLGRYPGGEAFAPDIEIWWRAAGATTWDPAKRIVRPWTHRQSADTIITHKPGIVKSGDLEDAKVRFVQRLRFRWPMVLDGGSLVLANDTRPADGAAIEFLCRYVGKATAQWPGIYQGTLGGAVQGLYDGTWTADDEGETYDPGIAYDADALAAMTEPCVLLVDKPIEDVRGYLASAIYIPGGYAPTLNAAGEISPVKFATPGPDDELPVLDNSDVVEDANAVEWSDDAEGAVNLVRYTYYVDQVVPLDADPNGQRSIGPGLSSSSVTQTYRGSALSRSVMGDAEEKIDAPCFRVPGGTQGQPYNADTQNDVGARRAFEAAAMYLDRRQFGCQKLQLRVLANEKTKALRAGDWVEVQLVQIPSYTSGVRGVSGIFQIRGINDESFVLRVLRLEYGGPALQPLLAPTLGGATSDSDGFVTVAMTTVVAGTEAALYYARSASEPAADSPLWTYAGRATVSGQTIVLPAQPAGAKVWLRARSVRTQRRPSGWTAATSHTLANTPRLLALTPAIADDGTITLAFAVNSFAAALRVAYAVHDPEATPAPTLSTTEDFATAGGSLVLDTPLPAGYALTAEITAYPTWTGSAASGPAGDTFPFFTPDLRSTSLPYVLTHSAAHTAGNLTPTLAATFNAATRFFEIYAQPETIPTIGGVALSAGGVPDADCRKGGRRPVGASMPEIRVTNAEWHFLFVAIGEANRQHVVHATVTCSGIPGDGSDGGDITAVPAVPALEKGTPAGGNQPATVTFTPTAALKTRLRWYDGPTLVHTQVLAAGDAVETRSYAVASPVKRASVELRHVSDDETQEGPPAYAGPLLMDGTV
jgi:hypothetical protein